MIYFVGWIATVAVMMRDRFALIETEEGTPAFRVPRLPSLGDFRGEQPSQTSSRVGIHLRGRSHRG